MILLPENEAEELLKEAKEAGSLSYSPYSKFVVGAALLTKDNRIFKGTNIENASYGLTICAERTAICNALTNGNVEIRAIAIWSDTDSISPCGACRQFIIEFGADIIVVFKHNNQILQKTISELLPFGFTKNTME